MRSNVYARVPRAQPAIQSALSKFTPKELRADEEKNRADVEARLREGGRILGPLLPAAAARLPTFCVAR